jgi:hypothetical protein
MTVAHFIEWTRAGDTGVPDKWLHEASPNHENVLLRDGNTYEIVDLHYTEAGHVRVDVVVTCPR